MAPDYVIQLLGFIGGLAILIIVHELGHFFAARFFKVGVDEFGIGFPPKILKLFSAGGTVFSLNWLPLGGFVRLRGDNDPSVEGGMAAASPWVRIAILFAGPLTNLALGAVLAVFLIYSLGETVPGKVQIQSISPESPAENAGLQVNDFILSVNSQPVPDVEKLQEMIYANLGMPVEISYQRGDQVSMVILVPRDPPPEDGAIGIMMGYATQPTTWSKAIPGGMALTAEYGKSVFSLPLRIVRGEVSPEESRPIGYKGMVDVYMQIRNPLYFFMIISLSLGIFNLLPIPALDGGRILFALAEIVFRRRVPHQFENMVHLVGFVMLIVLMIYINLLDFINPVQLPK